MNVVECEGLVKRFGRCRAVDGFSAEIGENRITGLVGRNGAGKTTFLKLLAGYIKPTAGQLRVFGEKPFNSLKVSDNLIFVDDEMAFPQTMTLDEILEEMPRFYPSFEMALARRLLDYFSLAKGQRTNRLSKGNRSMFFSILGIAARAPLTVFDEPTTGMDAGFRQDFYRALLKEYMAFPRTVIVSSHLLGEIAPVLEEIVLIDEGRLKLQISSDEAAVYAVGLRGGREAVTKAAGERQILAREEFEGGLYLAVKNDFTQKERGELTQSGVVFEPVGAEKLCVYLTRKNKGGIDDVLS